MEMKRFHYLPLVLTILQYTFGGEYETLIDFVVNEQLQYQKTMCVLSSESFNISITK